MNINEKLENGYYDNFKTTSQLYNALKDDLLESSKIQEKELQRALELFDDCWGTNLYEGPKAVIAAFKIRVGIYRLIQNDYK